MHNNYQITIILEDGMILKENAQSLESKTALQILQSHCKDSDNYILGIRKPTVINILQPDIIPLCVYPQLKEEPTNDEFSIPQLSLCILNQIEKQNTILIFQPIDESEKSIQFPPFIYSFSAKDSSKSISTIKADMTNSFGLSITDAKIFLDDKEVTNCLCQRFIENVKSSTNLKTIWFKFTITDNGKKKLKKRQYFVKEMIEVEQKFCSDIIQFLNQVGKNVQEARVFTEFEHKTIFGSIPDIFKACTRSITALTGHDSYNSYVGNIFLKSIPDLEENFKEFFANYRTKDLIPEILKRHKNNQLLENVVHQTFGKTAMSFESMVIMPIQILPRYILIFKNIVESTPKSHPEFFLLQRNIIELDKSIRKLEDYCKIREVMYLQKRMIPLEENKNQPIDASGRFLINKYNVNPSIICKSTIYLLNDMIILTKSTDTRELEKFRIKLDEFVFIPNYAASLIVFYHKKHYDILKFSSAETLKDLVTQLDCYRQKMFDSNPERSNSLLISEILLEEKIIVPKIIESSCCKIKSLITSASYGTYITYDTNNRSLNAFQNVKNIHTHAKIVSTENCPYEHIYGGEKYPFPLEFAGEKFVELRPKSRNSNSSSNCLNNVIPCQEPDEGRIYHTCCSYKNFIVIYGGYKTAKKNQIRFSSDVHFVNIETGEWFISKPGFEQEPEPRYKHSAVVYKNLMIIHGGINCKNGSILNDTWCFNFIDGQWSKIDLVQNCSIVPRFGHGAVMVNQYMFIIGGLTYSHDGSGGQIRIENSKEENISNESFTSNNEDENNNNDDDDLPSIDDEFMISTSISSNSYSGVSNCFSFDIENCLCFGLNAIGNFLPGLSMFSACYDDNNQQIIIFGGFYQCNKYEKYSPIFEKVSIPPFFISSSIADESEIREIGNKIKRKMSHSNFQISSKETNPTNDKREHKSLQKKQTKKINVPNLRPVPSTPDSKKVSFPKLNVNENPNSPNKGNK